jgi:GT2 family glycosyltransferase
VSAAVLVAICTKDRPDELRQCLTALAASTIDVECLIIDAGALHPAAEVCAEIGSSTGMRISRLEHRPHLAAQRNLAVDTAVARGEEVLVFVDDDVRVEHDTIERLSDRLVGEPTLAAVGAVVADEPIPRQVAVKAFFQLWSRRLGVVQRSGRNVLGHLPQGPFPRDVQWLSTCAVAFRLSALGDLRFDERLRGYSYGEDLDLTFRLGRRSRLAVDELARVTHGLSPSGRPDAGALAERRIVLLHAWVIENRDNGLRRWAFWWSVCGELLLLGVKAFASPASRRELMGVLTGSRRAVQGAGRDFDPGFRPA